MFSIQGLYKPLITSKVKELSSNIPVEISKQEKQKLIGQYKKDAEDYIASNFSLKFYKMNANNNGFIIYEIKIIDFIMAFIDIFSVYNNGNSIGIFRNFVTIPPDINPSEPYINSQYTDLMNTIKSNAARPSLNLITPYIK